MSPTEDHRRDWSTAPGPREPGPAASEARRSGAGSFFSSVGRGLRTLVVLGILVAAVIYALKHGSPAWNKFRLNADVESAAVFFARQLPATAEYEADLRGKVAAVAEDKLKSHLAQKARWFVCVGRRGDSATVLRDDHFSEAEKKFVKSLIDDARTRGDEPGVEHQTLAYPLGGRSRPVTVGDETIYVVAGWCE